MPAAYEKVTEYRKKNGNLVPVYPATSTDNVIDTDGTTLLSAKLSAMDDEIGGKAEASHAHDASDISAGTLAAARIPNLDASKITTGTISIDRLPAGALERLVVVANQAARFALTTSHVQLGDTVKQEDTGLMYYVTDASKLNSAAGYEEYTAGTATKASCDGSGNNIVQTYVSAVGATTSSNTLQVTKNGTASNVGLPAWADYGTSLPSASEIAAMPDGACFILYES